MIRRKTEHTFTMLNVDYVILDSKWNYKNVISPYNRIYYIDKGEGELSDTEVSIKLRPGHLYLVPSFTLCNMSCSEKLGQYFVQFFENTIDGISVFFHNRKITEIKASEIDHQLFKRLVTINPGRGINRSDNPKIYEKDIFYKEYQELNNRQNRSVSMETQGILWQLSAKFLHFSETRQGETMVIPQKIAETLEYIQLNLDGELTVNYLASRINQHEDYFSRQFKQCTGTRPHQFITEKRIERAQYLMAITKLNYSGIAVKTGFQDLAHFSKTFKKITGISPRDYKKQMYAIGFTYPASELI